MKNAWLTEECQRRLPDHDVTEVACVNGRFVVGIGDGIEVAMPWPEPWMGPERSERAIVDDFVATLLDELSQKSSP